MGAPSTEVLQVKIENLTEKIEKMESMLERVLTQNAEEINRIKEKYDGINSTIAMASGGFAVVMFIITNLISHIWK